MSDRVPGFVWQISSSWVCSVLAWSVIKQHKETLLFIKFVAFRKLTKPRVLGVWEWLECCFASRSTPGDNDDVQMNDASRDD